MSIKIISDSTSDLPEDLVKELDITVLPLRILFGDEEFRDGLDLTNSEFYDKLAKSRILPTTAQIGPGEFLEEFSKHLNNGDEVIGIFISSKLSGTCGSAMIAKEMLSSDNIRIIDSLNVTFGLGLLVIEAARMVKRGKKAEEIVCKIEEVKNKVCFYGIINNLEYLKRGGRLSSAGAFAGNLFGIKPLITVKDGEVAVIGNARGQKKAIAWVMEDIKKKKMSLNNKLICIGYNLPPEDLVSFQEALFRAYTPNEVIVMKIGAVVGTHAGPSCVGFSCLP